MVIRSRRFMNEDGTVPGKLLYHCIREHKQQIERLGLLDRYYNGDHEILNRTMSDGLPNNKMVCNHAKYIADIATGYVFGIPVQYAGDESVDELNKHYTDIDEDSHNNDIGLDMAIFGHALELIYMSTDAEPIEKLAVISPLNAFVVVDDTVDEKPMFAVVYTERRNLDNVLEGYDVTVYTETHELKYETSSLDTEVYKELEAIPHYFGGVPLIQYKNNKRCIGDYEPVLTLIDAYNKLQSDRLNDKEQLVDALLAVSGVTFGDNEKEMSETAKLLREWRILEMPEGAEAEWLIKNLDEEKTEVLKASIKDDIHEFSGVPCLTDKEFIGNSSGVAIKYKLIAFESLAKVKERYFKQGLRKRLHLTSNVKSIKAVQLDVSEIDITMKRSLPVDEETLAKIAKETEGLVSWETRVKGYNPELDVEEERKKLEEEKKTNMEMQQQAFGNYGFSTESEDEEDGKNRGNSI